MGTAEQRYSSAMLQLSNTEKDITFDLWFTWTTCHNLQGNLVQTCLSLGLGPQGWQASLIYDSESHKGYQIELWSSNSCDNPLKRRNASYTISNTHITVNTNWFQWGRQFIFLVNSVTVCFQVRQHPSVAVSRNSRFFTIYNMIRTLTKYPLLVRRRNYSN